VDGDSRLFFNSSLEMLSALSRAGTYEHKTKNKKKLSEEAIDQIVIAQADDDSAWEKPVRVRRTRPASVSIPPDLAARAAFLARLHRTKSTDEWLTHIIEERIELEEAAFIGAKQDLAAKAS
jgi:hypothetical protein